MFINKMLYLYYDTSTATCAVKYPTIFFNKLKLLYKLAEFTSEK